MKTAVVILAWLIFAACIVCAVRLRTDYQPREVWLRPKRWNRLHAWFIVHDRWKRGKCRYSTILGDTIFTAWRDFWWSPATDEWLNTWQENGNSVRKAVRK